MQSRCALNAIESACRLRDWTAAQQPPIVYAAADGAQVPPLLNLTEASFLWCARLEADVSSLGLEEYWDLPGAVGKMSRRDGWKLKVQVAVRTRDFAHWRRQAENQATLRSYINIRSIDKLGLQTYLTVPHGGWNDRIRLGRVALTQIRLGSSILRINTGRWEGLMERERICPCCRAAVETEQHFLLACPSRADARATLWQDLDQKANAVDAASASSVGSSSIPFSMAALSSDEQLRVMVCEGHPSIPDGPVARRVMSRILIELGIWMETRRVLHQELTECAAAKLG